MKYFLILAVICIALVNGLPSQKEDLDYELKRKFFKQGADDYDELQSDWDRNLGSENEFEALLIYLLNNKNECNNGNKQKCRRIRTNQNHRHHYNTNVESINPESGSNDDYIRKVSTRSLDSINGGYFVKRANIDDFKKVSTRSLDSINGGYFVKRSNDNDDFKKVSTRSLDSINGGYFVKRFAL
uniref:Uncharacterized protein n=1 Tax=Megaselia scalaris TaxID=36166 RepID=T1H2K0_MEGSC